MNKETNVINWIEAFDDEGFMCKLKNVIEQVLEEHIAAEDDIDELFTYDENTETLTLNREVFSNTTTGKSSESSEKNNEQLTDEDIEKTTNNLKLKLLYELMIYNGLKLDKNNMTGDKSKSKKHENHGNGVKAAKIMHLITGIPFQTCKNFISDPTFNHERIRDLITKINSKLIDLGMKIRL